MSFTFIMTSHDVQGISSKHWLFGVLPVENLTPSNLLLAQNRTVKRMWSYHSCCLMRQLTQVIPTVMIHHRRSTELTTVPVCYLLNCINIIIMPLALLAIVYKVNAVITSWLVPIIQCIP